jgi:ATP-dependent DNA helicase RecG
MRPPILFPLFAPTTSIPGIGPRLAALIARVAGNKLTDLLWRLPSGLTDWREIKTVADAVPGERALFRLQIVEHQPPRNPKSPYKILATDGTSFIELTFFRPHKDYLDKTFPKGETRLIGGRMEMFKDRPAMAHPERIFTEAEAETGRMIDTIYPLTEGLMPKVMAKAAAYAVAQTPDLAEWQDAAWRQKNEWPSWQSAIRTVHAPSLPSDLEPTHPARMRLAYDEILANQLSLSLVRERMKAVAGRRVDNGGALRAKALAALPFTLTAAQQSALGELDVDLASGDRMLRLLQGDVGSGKTAVAFLAMTGIWASGGQTALMAPTEVLARQHAATLSVWAEKAGLRMALLTGRDKGTAREATTAALARGEIDLLVGTHALISEDVAFKDLGLVVIDEQHRFGVQQRMALGAKATRPPHVVVMTATPIPRSLALAQYGDMDMTRITGKPPGRQAIDTKALPLARLDDVIAAVGRAVDRGERVYWVCPLVEENEEIDAKAAEARHAELGQIWGNKVGLMHGRMKAAEKDAAISNFKSGQTAILVSTTVIEVGVDVPEATVMIVEHAERFGLAQLHQLRGRVGRGKAASACILLYQSPLGETARARINTLRDTDDGFVIAEKDLELRGAGELLGQRQSGQAIFRMAALDVHGSFLAVAQDDARLVLARDPELKSPRGEALRVLLYLFERDEAVKTLRAG